MESIKRFFKEAKEDKEMTTGKLLMVLGCAAAAIGAIQLGELLRILVS